MTPMRQAALAREAQDAAKAIWEAHATLLRLQREWNGANLTATWDETAMGENLPTKAQFSSVIFDTADALSTLFSQGHATNVTNLLT